jgi:hypothetical protein
MITLGAVQILFLITSIAFVAAAMFLIARSRAGRLASARRWMPGGAAISGFVSGFCLGAAAAWGRAILPLVLSGLAMGLALGTATGAISRRVARYADRGRQASGVGDGLGRLAGTESPERQPAAPAGGPRAADFGRPGAPSGDAKHD